MADRNHKADVHQRKKKRSRRRSKKKKKKCTKKKSRPAGTVTFAPNMR